ncbi:MAG: hypothetical protein DWQ02_18750 [Bacteroidetes bacterium]|nr:MAG: hypothetical protein DWQ02_18750 [Bacteroidota bacterium]
MKSFTLFLTTIFLLLSCNVQQKAVIKKYEPLEDHKVVAYVTGWQNNWGEFQEKALQITHINYAFANIKDGKVVDGGEKDTPDLIKLNDLKKVNPNLKILISVGGWSWSGGFSDAVLTDSSRQVFANSAIDYMLRHKIDGIDLDWEYPGLPGAGNTHRPEDKENFTAILKLLREKLDALTASGHQPYLLTVATAASQWYLDHVNMAEAHKYLDFVNIMTYDYYTGGSPLTGHHSNLHLSKNENDPRIISSSKSVNLHIKSGIPVEKLVLGVPFYGRYWTSTNAGDTKGLYQLSKGEKGSYHYKFIEENMIDKDGFEMVWDSVSMAPYLWRESDRQFVTFENPASLKLKTEFVKDKGMGGVMFWQFNQDNGKLLNTIYSTLKKDKNQD